MPAYRTSKPWHELDDSWMEQAPCATIENAVDLFFADGNQDQGGQDLETKLKLAEAKAICLECCERTRCLDYALAGRIEDGVWGGTTGPEREKILRRRRRLR